MPTVNNSFGNRIAVLAGDFLFAQASWYLANLDDLEVVKLLSKVITDFAEGEIRQSLTAFDGDMIGMQREITAEVAKLGDLQSLNFAEKKALEELTGQEIGQLQRQVSIFSKFPELRAEELAAAQALLDTGKDISEISMDDVAAQTEKIKNQEEMQSQMDKLSNSTSALSTGLTDAFAPIAAFLIPLLTDVVDIVGGILMPIFKIIGSVLKTTFGMLTAILSPIFAIGKAIIGALSEPLESIGEAIEPIVTKFSELKTKIMPYLDPLISIFTQIGNILGNIVGGAIGLVVDGV
jgi:hypothetical protein